MIFFLKKNDSGLSHKASRWARRRIKGFEVLIVRDMHVIRYLKATVNSSIPLIHGAQIPRRYAVIPINMSLIVTLVSKKKAIDQSWLIRNKVNALFLQVDLMASHPFKVLHQPTIAFRSVSWRAERMIQADPTCICLSW